MKLTPGSVCVANGRVVEIDGPDSLTSVRVRDQATGEMSSVSHAALHPLPKSSAGPSAGTLSKEQWERCSSLARAFEPFKGKATLSQSELKRIAGKHGLSTRQVQRLRARFERNPLASALAEGPSGRPEGSSLLITAVDALIKTTIAEHYFKRERPSKEHIVRRVRAAATEAKLPVPSRKAILARTFRSAADVLQLRCLSTALSTRAAFTTARGVRPIGVTLTD